MDRKTREVTAVKPLGMASFSPRFELSLLPLSGSFTVFPGFCDVHVHFREPGFSYKETIRTGSLAAARGGYSAVCTMPNLSPVPDSAAHLEAELELIRRDAGVQARQRSPQHAGQHALLFARTPRTVRQRLPLVRRRVAAQNIITERFRR